MPIFRQKRETDRLFSLRRYIANMTQMIGSNISREPHSLLLHAEKKLHKLCKMLHNFQVRIEYQVYSCIIRVFIRIEAGRYQ